MTENQNSAPEAAHTVTSATEAPQTAAETSGAQPSSATPTSATTGTDAGCACESACGSATGSATGTGTAKPTEDAPQKPALRGIYILPNLFTTASLFTGFLALIFAVNGDMDSCALAILFSAFMDGLDGKVARLTNTASEFGVQYDSLADLVAFGVAPAFMFWLWQLQHFGRLGIGVGFLFVACAALRLARFNVSTAVTSKKFFIGLPSPAGGCSLALVVLFAPYVPDWYKEALPATALIVCFVVALLMVSRVRYFSFKEYGFLRTHPFKSMVTALVLFVFILAEPRIFGFIICVVYLLSGIIYSFILLPRRNRELLNSLTQNLH